MRRKPVTLNCLVCKKEFSVVLSRAKKAKYCSRACVNIAWKKFFSKEGNPKWKNGVKMNASGYRTIASPNHPYKDKQGYVREHHLVMEKKIGRYVLPHEVVHHLDENKLNNDISNLVLLSSKSEHIKKYHRDSGKETWFKKGIRNVFANTL